MNDIHELLSSYKSTISSLRAEVSSLTTRVSEQSEASDPESFLSTLSKQIDETHQKISDLKQTLTHQASEQEWVNQKYPKSNQILSLKSKLSELESNLRQARRKQIEDESKLLLIEKFKQESPKLFVLVQKMLQVQERNLKLKQLVSKSEEKKRKLREKYSEIATTLSQEELVKKKIKETEPKVKNKEEIVKNLMKKLTFTQKMTEETIDRIEESEFKELWMRCLEVRGLRSELFSIISRKEKEIEDLANLIIQTEQHPEKIPPATANQSLRQEIKAFEKQIPERSIEEKQLERTKFQLSFQLDCQTKELQELRAFVKSLTEPADKDSEKTLKKNEKSEEKPQRKSLPVTLSKSEKQLDQKRKTAIEILGKGITDGMGKTVMNALKNVGKPGQGLASKVIELNRSQFSSPRSLLSY